MRSSWLLGLLARVLAVVALVGSGTYVIVYLWRWEWIRALITGVLFLATLVVVSTWAILSSLRRIGERIDDLEEHARASNHVAKTIRRASAGHATRHFDWLREPPDRTGVFVPILLGAGAVMSALAYLIERLAGAVGGPAIDRTTVRLLAYDVPLGDPAAPPVPTRAGRAAGRAEGAATRPAAAGGRPRGTARTVIALVGVAVVVVGTIWALREATQNRPDPDPRPARTEIELEVRQRSGLGQPSALGTALWSACSPRLGPARHIGLVDVVEGGPGRVVLVLDHTLGKHARRRLVGCMEDTVLDDVQADVIGMTRS